MSSDTEPITFNGQAYEPDTFRAALQVATNGHDLKRDPSVLRSLGKQFDGRRDLYEALGYEEDLELEDYRAKYERGGIAKRLVEIYPKDTWKDAPEIVDEGSETETQFERQANRLVKQTLNHYWRRGDIAAGLGEYAVLFLGFADGQPLSEPVQASALSSPEDLANIEVFPQDDVEGWTLGKNSTGEAAEPSHERYSKPVVYELDFADVDAEESEHADGTDIRDVHWQRVIHIPTEDLLETDLKGIPRLKPVYNRLEDLEKVIGSAGEAFWTTAQPKIIGNVADGYADIGPDDRAEIRDDMEQLVHDLQQYMLTSGMEFEVLDGDTPDPSGAQDSILQQIASAVGVPKNKLLGNEMGERSTTQDRRNWFDSVATRQRNHAAPLIARPTIDRLTDLDVLPAPTGDDYAVEFPSLFELTEKEQAELESSRAQSLSGSQLAMALPADVKMEYIKTGEFPDSEDSATELPVNETDPRVREHFDDAFGPVENADVSAGDPVETPRGDGVVTDVVNDGFEFDGEDVERGMVVVALADGGMDFFPQSEVSASDWFSDEDVTPTELAEGTTENVYQQAEAAGVDLHDAAFTGYLAANEDPEVGFRTLPDGWTRKSVLQAWASLGGTFRTCRADMAGEIASPARFCAALKDEVLGTERWRNKF